MSFSSDPSLLINQLPISVEFPSDDRFIEVMSLLYKRMANAINTKEGSLFPLIEIGNFQQYYIQSSPNTFRNVYRKTFDMVNLNAGPIAAGATVSVAHGITGLVKSTHIYGSAKNSDVPSKFIPLPYVSATLITDQVQIYLTSTNIVLVNGATQSILTDASIVAEYTKV